MWPQRLLSDHSQVHDALARSRLLQHMTRSDWRVIVICAPSGYGKTTLARQFVDMLDLPTVWQTLDDRDRDMVHLHAQSIATLQRAFPALHHAPSTHLGAQEAATELAYRLRDTLDKPLLYVLDDVQNIVGIPHAASWLRTLVEQSPSTVRFVLLSQLMPDLPFPDLQTHHDVLHIGQAQLRFTDDEISDLADLWLNTPLSTDGHEWLHRRLEGWPAGTTLALQTLASNMDPFLSDVSEGALPESVFETLAAKLLDAQLPDLREFLLTSSTLTRINPELCGNILQLPRCADNLTRVQRRNLFVTYGPGGLSYHQLFREFLQRQLQVRQPERFTLLHARAGEWFEQRDAVDEAVIHYLTAGLYKQAADLAERTAPAYFAEGRVEVLLTWGRKLQSVFESVPRLLLRCGQIYIDRHDYTAAHEALNLAEIGFQQQNNAERLLFVRHYRTRILLQEGHYHEAINDSLTQFEDARLFPDLKRYILRVLGAAQLYLGAVTTAIEYLELALPLYRAYGDQYALSQILQDLNFAYLRLGRFEDAAAALQEVIALQRGLGTLGPLAQALNNLGYHHHQQGDYAQARTVLHEAIGVATKTGNRRLQGVLFWSLGDIERDCGLVEEAHTLYERAFELVATSDSPVRLSILLSLSTLERWRGNLDEASSLAEAALLLADEHGLVLEGELARASLWVTRAEWGAPKVALHELVSLAEAMTDHHAPTEQMLVLGWCIRVALLCNDSQARDQAFAVITAISRQGGSLQPLAAEIVHHRTLSAWMARRITRLPVLASLVRGLETLQSPQASVLAFTSQTSRTTYSLRIFTLGDERVERDGIPLPSADWKANAARELFFYLLFVGPSTRESISLEFWPDSTPTRVRANFHTTLHRARTALGESTLPFEDGLYRLSENVEVWCDALELETLVGRASRLSPRDGRTEDLWRRAVELYKGDFLPSVGTGWVAPRREALHEAYLTALLGLGKSMRLRQGYAEAVEILRRGLREDPFNETFHRAILQCYADIGEVKRVLTHYQELQTLLRDELDVEPSDETTALVATLLK